MGWTCFKRKRNSLGSPFEIDDLDDLATFWRIISFRTDNEGFIKKAAVLPMMKESGKEQAEDIPVTEELRQTAATVIQDEDVLEIFDFEDWDDERRKENFKNTKMEEPAGVEAESAADLEQSYRSVGFQRITWSRTLQHYRIELEALFAISSAQFRNKILQKAKLPETEDIVQAERKQRPQKPDNTITEYGGSRDARSGPAGSDGTGR